MTTTLYIMIGQPGAGKSTFIQGQVPKATVISPDRVLQEKWDYQWTPVRAGMAWATCYQTLGRTITERAIAQAMGDTTEVEYVWDAVCPAPRDRASILNTAKGAGWKVVAVYLETPYEVCVARNNLRPKNRRVPDKSMVDISRRLTPPDDAEGWDDTICVKWEGVT